MTFDQAIAHVSEVAREQLANTLEPGAMLHVLVHAYLNGAVLETSADIDAWLQAYTGLPALAQKGHGSARDGSGDSGEP